MPANNRIYYASQGLQLKPENVVGILTNRYSGWYDPQGVQSVGITTNFSLQPVFQMGQLELYDLVESVPEVEMTINKVTDGTPPLYAMCMGGSAGIADVNNKQLAELCNNRVSARLSIFQDNQTAATGTPMAYVDCSGMYLSRFSYSFPIDGNATEEITLVGNNKYWNSGTALGFGDGSSLFEFQPSPNVSTGAMPSAPGIIRRANINLLGSVLPTGSGGLPMMTGIEALPNGNVYPHIQSINISADLGREAVYELGSMAPYFRYVRFPLEIKSEFTIAGTRGDFVEANDFSSVTGCGKDYKNTYNKTISIQVCGGIGDNVGTFSLNLGAKNKLTSVNYNGGDTGGGNVNISYSFITYNTFSMTLTGTYIQPRWIDNVQDSDNYNALNINRKDINPEDDLSSSDFGNIIDTNKPRRLFRKK
jgi:hypothetical protein